MVVCVCVCVYKANISFLFCCAPPDFATREILYMYRVITKYLSITIAYLLTNCRADDWHGRSQVTLADVDPKVIRSEGIPS